jgi:hypothetical protein
MAQKNIINQVKTADGYDTLYPLTPYQVHQAQSVTGDGSSYVITIDLPAKYITIPVLISFTPNVANKANCTVSVNGLATKPLYVNNVPTLANSFGVKDICLIQYDVNKDVANVIGQSGAPLTGDRESGTTVFDGDIITFTDINGDTHMTVFNEDGSITETLTRGTSISIINTYFNTDGSITEVIS